MATNSEDGLYVGYRRDVPAGVHRFKAVVFLVLLVLIPAMMAAMAVEQREQPRGVYEFGETRTFEGILYETPLPVLYMGPPFRAPLNTQGLHALVVSEGKAGFPEFASGNHGQKVRFEGALIYRDKQLMIEMAGPESFEVLRRPLNVERRDEPRDLGDVWFVGELVDTKCYLGAMRPGDGKVHRACAVRCLEGGVPPGLLVRDRDGRDGVFMLAGPSGESLDVNPQWAGRLVRAEGSLEVHDDTAVLRVQSLTLAPTGP